LNLVQFTVGERRGGGHVMSSASGGGRGVPMATPRPTMRPTPLPVHHPPHQYSRPTRRGSRPNQIIQFSLIVKRGWGWRGGGGEEGGGVAPSPTGGYYIRLIYPFYLTPPPPLLTHTICSSITKGQYIIVWSNLASDYLKNKQLANTNI
jgi:hypothetical protein